MNQPESIQEKLAEYQSILAFVQSELIGDRAKLAKAKKENQPLEVIEMIESDIEKLEQGVDRYQGWISILKNKLKNAS
ncbi:hypothetical protein [uncultured Algoriphagus sp.]|uniref:hypothetical protein n=1 Tax=uncultured Algoriphagus sp. TaxID=417365 RepID=UPI0025901372|nr:hypothetical protein [uncultured Algoriphagus sp.]